MAIALAVSTPLALYAAAPALLVWIVVVAAYRRFFHPLAGVPGPFLPSVTRLCLWYHNFIRDGQYYKKIEEMHARYGTRTPLPHAPSPFPSLGLASSN